MHPLSLPRIKRICVERGVTQAEYDDWLASDAPEYPPGYIPPYGFGILRATPLLPGQPGFNPALTTVTDDDKLELLLLATNGSIEQSEIKRILYPPGKPDAQA